MASIFQIFQIPGQNFIVSLIPAYCTFSISLGLGLGLGGAVLFIGETRFFLPLMSMGQQVNWFKRLGTQGGDDRYQIKKISSSLNS